jgi:predicted RNA-binding Zn-ribbon protein involved in translation (DUF1610 family)
MPRTHAVHPLELTLRPCEPPVLLSIIEQFTSIGEAEAAATALDAAGIDIALFDDEIVRIDWLYSNAVGGVKIIVRDEDYDTAADVLDFPAEDVQESSGDVPSEPASDTAEVEEPESPHCPSCGLTSIAAIPKFRVFACLLLLLFAVGRVINQLGLAAVAVAVIAVALAVTPSHFCRECGEKFTRSRRRADVDESPLPQDLIDDTCPRCGSTEIHRVYHRRLKALGLFQPLLLVVLVLWPFLSKRACDVCGFRS